MLYAAVTCNCLLQECYYSIQTNSPSHISSMTHDEYNSSNFYHHICCCMCINSYRYCSCECFIYAWILYCIVLLWSYQLPHAVVLLCTTKLPQHPMYNCIINYFTSVAIIPCSHAAHHLVVEINTQSFLTSPFHYFLTVYHHKEIIHYRICHTDIA